MDERKTYNKKMYKNYVKRLENSTNIGFITNSSMHDAAGYYFANKRLQPLFTNQR